MPDMLSMIRTLGDQLRWAANLDSPVSGRWDEVVLAGMGGSGISGNYGAALTAAGRVTVHKDYGPLPGWVESVRPLVIAASYSGNTEETLSVAEDARARELDVVTVTTGGRLSELAEEEGWPTVLVPPGLQPRAALGYLFGAVARLLSSAGLTPDTRDDLMEAAALAEEMVAEDGETWEQASAIASALRGRISIVYGGGPISGTVAGRWKTQINENAKMPAWASVLPELDHNELVGWETLRSMTSDLIGIVALTDISDHPRVGARLTYSRSLTETAVPWVGEVVARGESATARLISLTVVGDLVSWMMAKEAGVDPVPVDTIERLKRLLADS